ncbi:MAG: universal stress protein [Flavobacterium sp.]|nr:universal stress protein [Flavobacterium sp.]
MKKILFPTDFSAASINAFVYALHIAKRLHAEIITVHIFQVPIGNYLDDGDFLSENYNISELGNFENYKDEVPKLKAIAESENCNHIKMSHILHSGVVVDDILYFAEKENADYIIMGTKGASGLKETFIGSITEKIMSRASAIVLAIPENCRYNPISKILFLTQFQEKHFTYLEKLLKIAKQFDASIDVLNVVDVHDHTAMETVNHWKKAFPSSTVHFHVIASKDPADTVLDFANLHMTDVIVVQVKYKSFFEQLFFNSMSRQLAFHSEIPIMKMHS